MIRYSVGFQWLAFSTSLLSLIIFITVVNASSQSITVYYFVAEGCEHCIRAENYINTLKTQYPDIVFQRFDIYNSTNMELFIALAEGFNITEENRDVPAVFLGDTCLIGEETIIQNLENLILEYNYGREYRDKAGEIIRDSVEGYRPPISLPLIASAVTAALAGSLNPCTFAAIISLISYAFRESSSRHMLKTCGAFITGILVFYFSTGLVLLQAIGMLHYFSPPIVLRYLFGLIAIVFSILEFKEFFFYGRGLSLEHPGILSRIFGKYSYNTNIVIGFLLGIIVSIIGFSCTGVIYITALIYPLSKIGLSLEGFLLFILYNLILILPPVIILFIVYFGRNVMEIDAWRIEKRRYMRLLAGILLLTVGIAIIAGLI